MAFGEQSGPPATARQARHLTALIVAAGYRDIRDARGPLGLTQRQAGGRFTRHEADALIAVLEGAGSDVRLPRATPRREPRHVAMLRGIPSDLLAAELQQRGWIVMEP